MGKTDRVPKVVGVLADPSQSGRVAPTTVPPPPHMISDTETNALAEIDTFLSLLQSVASAASLSWRYDQRYDFRSAFTGLGQSSPLC